MTTLDSQEEQSLLDPELAKYDSDVSRIIKVLELQVQNMFVRGFWLSTAVNYLNVETTMSREFPN